MIEEGLARAEGSEFTYRANLLSMLCRREVLRVGAQLANELGLGYVETHTGERVAGVYRRPVELASGRYALIEKSREFTLVPWRAVLDRHLGEFMRYPSWTQTVRNRPKPDGESVLNAPDRPAFRLEPFLKKSLGIVHGIA